MESIQPCSNFTSVFTVPYTAWKRSKYRAEKTPYLDTFHLVLFVVIWNLLLFVEMIQIVQNKNISLYSFTIHLFETKNLQNRFLLTLTVTKPKGFVNYWHSQELFKLLLFYEKLMLLLFYHFSGLCLQRCMSWFSNIMKTKTSMLQWFAIALFKTALNRVLKSTTSKKVTSNVNFQLRPESC